MQRVKVKTKDGVFDCTGTLLFKGRNCKAVYSRWKIGINNRHVHVVQSDADGQVRAFYKNEILSIEVIQ